MKKYDPESMKIAVVDDDPAIRLATTRLLRGEGYEVIEASCGAEAEKMLRENTVDLVLTDVSLGDMDGRDLCERMRDKTDPAGTIWVLVSNTFKTSEDQVDGLLRGADTYIARPIQNRELLARVKALIRVVAARKEQQAAIEDLKKLEMNKKEEIRALKMFTKAAIDRELRMIELKKEVNDLCREMGRVEPYALLCEDDFNPE